MRKLLGGALALLTTGAVAQSGNTWSSLLSQGTDPASWPAGLEAIHMGHMPPASGNQYDRELRLGRQR